jgi:hypothetical protein
MKVQITHSNKFAENKTPSPGANSRAITVKREQRAERTTERGLRDRAEERAD